MSEDPRSRFGRRAEAHAAKALRRQGYRIVARNWRCAIGEIDLIAQHGGDLVIVEVKARENEAFGGPELAVGPAKQRKLSRLLEAYLAERGWDGVNARFDVVAVVLDERGRLKTAEIFRDAFELLG